MYVYFVSGWSAKDLCIIHRHHAAKCAWNQLFYYLLLSNACTTLTEITGVASYVFITVCYNLEVERCMTSPAIIHKSYCGQL